MKKDIFRRKTEIEIVYFFKYMYINFNFYIFQFLFNIVINLLIPFVYYEICSN